jgi:phosphatidylglycerol:prolipoprotein diacylglycerol transferase
MEFQSEFILIADRLQIRYYGIIIVLAMLVAAYVASRLAKRGGLDPDHIWGALTWAIIPALIGARLWYILFPPVDAVAAGRDTLWFFQNFFDLQNGAIAIWSGGLSIFGALLGGFLGAYIYLRRQKLPMLPWLDIAGIALPLGQAIGRFANYVNQELYGAPTSLLWGIPIDREHRVDPYTSPIDYPYDSTRFHPLFLYEAIWNFGAFLILSYLYTRKRKYFRDGDFFLLYIMQYAYIRFMLEFIRVPVAYVAGVNVSQAICLVAFVVCLFIFFWRRRSAPKTAQPVKQA